MSVINENFEKQKILEKINLLNNSSTKSDKDQFEKFEARKRDSLFSSDSESSPSGKTKCSSIETLRRKNLCKRKSLQKISFPNICYPDLNQKININFSPIPNDVVEEELSEDSYESKKNNSRSFHSDKYFRDKRDLIEDMFNLSMRNTAEVIEEMSKEPSNLNTVKECEEEDSQKDDNKIIFSLHDLSKDLKHQMNCLSDFFDANERQRPCVAKVVDEEDRISENDSEYNNYSDSENNSSSNGSFILRRNKPEFFTDKSEPAFEFYNLKKLKHIKYNLKDNLKGEDSIIEESNETDLFNEKGLNSAIGKLRKNHVNANYFNQIRL